MNFLILLTAILFVAGFFSGAAMDLIHRLKKEKLTTYKADPRSFLPTVYLKDCLKTTDAAKKNLISLQEDVFAETAITQKNTGKSISAASLQLASAYQTALARHFNTLEKKDIPLEIKKILNRTELCHQAIQCEKETFLTDNGEASSDFIFNRQNAFTDLILTGVTIPLLIGAINLDAKSLTELRDSFLINPILKACLCVVLLLGAYRFFKYNRNKRSMLRSQCRTELYTKAEFITCIFENALKDYLAEHDGEN